MMDSRHATSYRKRKVRHVEDEAWDCSVCTYKNSAEAFRCGMCQTRKGTSTRKPKLNQQLVEEQSLIARTILKDRHDGEEGTTRRRGRAVIRSATGSLPGYGNVDRSSPLMFKIFANGYSVVITEFKPKSIVKQSSSVPDSPAPSNASSLQGFTSTPLGGANSDQPSPLDQPYSCGLSIGTGRFSEFQDDFSATNNNNNNSNNHTLPDEHNRRFSSSASENAAPNSSDSSSLDVKSIQEGVDEEAEAPVPAPPRSWASSFSSTTANSSSRKRPFSPSISRFVASPLGLGSSSPRSLRSSLLGSKTRQASKIARASLYQNVAENHHQHPYKRRRVLNFRQRQKRNTANAVRRKAVLPIKPAENPQSPPKSSSASTTSTDIVGKPGESKNTTAMTDSRGASTLEMST